MAAAILAGAGMYVVVLLSTGVVLPWRELLAGEPAWATGVTVRASLGTGGVTVLSVAVAMAIFTGINGFFMASSRLLFSMGRARLLPAWFGAIDPARGTPRNALLFTGAVSLLAPWFGREAIVWVVDMAAGRHRVRLPVHLPRGFLGGPQPVAADGGAARRGPVRRVLDPLVRSRDARLHGARFLDRPGGLDRARRAVLLRARPGVRGDPRHRAGPADPRNLREFASVMMGHRRRGCHRGGWNRALASPKRPSGHNDDAVATRASPCAAAIRIGDDSGACLAALAKRVSGSAPHSPPSCASDLAAMGSISVSLLEADAVLLQVPPCLARILVTHPEHDEAVGGVAARAVAAAAAAPVGRARTTRPRSSAARCCPRSCDRLQGAPSRGVEREVRRRPASRRIGLAFPERDGIGWAGPQDPGKPVGELVEDCPPPPRVAGKHQLRAAVGVVGVQAQPMPSAPVLEPPGQVQRMGRAEEAGRELHCARDCPGAM